VLLTVLLGFASNGQRASGQVPSIVIVPPPVTNSISFSGLTGLNGDLFSSYTEGAFTIVNTAGLWYKGFSYGSPSPSIFDGPSQNPGVGVLRITDSADLFTFVGFDYSSNNGNSGYEVEGFLGANKVFDETGTLFTPNFSTYFSLSPTNQIDALLIHVFPGFGNTSINLDNIRVTTVPEPFSGALCGMALAAAFFCRKLQRR